MVAQKRSLMFAGMLFGAGMMAALVGTLVVGGTCGRRMSRSTSRPRRSFPALSGAIVGTTKWTVMDVFGPPPTATRGQGTDWLTSETWYYPLDVREQSAMAIRFGGRDGRAVAVEQIWAPH